MFKAIMLKLGYVPLREHTDTVSELLIEAKTNAADDVLVTNALKHLNQALKHMPHVPLPQNKGEASQGHYNYQLARQSIMKAITLLEC